MPAFAPLVHQLARLRRDDGPIGIAVTRRPAEADVRAPADLPDCLLEIHVFRDGAAEVFADGVNHVGRNSVIATVSGNIVLVARFDAARGSGDTLDEAVPLFDHTHGMMDDVRHWASRAEREQSEQDLEKTRRATVAQGWRGILDAVAALPRSARGRPIAEADLREITDAKLILRGTFNPDLEMETGYHGTSSVMLEKQPDGSVKLRTSYLASVNDASLPHRLAAARQACADAGFAFEEATRQPVKVLQPGDDLAVPLAAIIPLWHRLVVLWEAAVRVERARVFMLDRDLLRTLQTLAGGGKISQFSGGKPGRLEGADGKGRGLTGIFIATMAKHGFIDRTAKSTTPSGTEYNLEWTISELGRVPLADNAEALAQALHDRNALLSERNRNVF